MVSKLFNIKITGRVQGIGFRFSALRQADTLGIKGFVRNEPDGSVYIEAEGEDSVLQEFIKWCHKGPYFAKMHDVRVEERELKNFTDFRISW